MGIPRGRGNILPASGGGKLKGAKIWSVMRCACKCDAIRQVQALRRSCRRSPETESEALPNRRAHVGNADRRLAGAIRPRSVNAKGDAGFFAPHTWDNLHGFKDG